MQRPHLRIQEDHYHGLRMIKLILYFNHLYLGVYGTKNDRRLMVEYFQCAHNSCFLYIWLIIS
jgi:hypothetical protein